MAQTDLHIHSSLTAGGELSPRALAERCCEKRLTLAALTDRVITAYRLSSSSTFIMMRCKQHCGLVTRLGKPTTCVMPQAGTRMS